MTSQSHHHILVESKSQHSLSAGELALFEHDQLLSPKEIGARLFRNIFTSTQWCTYLNQRVKKMLWSVFDFTYARVGIN